MRFSFFVALLSLTSIGCSANKPSIEQSPKPTPQVEAPKTPVCGDALCNKATELMSCPEDCVDQWTPEMDFVVTWDSKKGSTVTLPTGEGKYYYKVDWDNDHTFESGVLVGATTHTYTTPGPHTIRLRGTFPHLDNSQYKFDTSIARVEQWGTIEWRSMRAMFQNQIALVSLPADGPNLSNVTDMSNMFYGASAFNQDLDAWDTSNVTTMEAMFEQASVFDSSIDGWDTSNVTNMSSMFDLAEAFNQPLNSWNTSKVNTMEVMFSRANSFNQPLDKWDTSNVTNMSGMFEQAVNMNHSIGGWNISQVKHMDLMFDRTNMGSEMYDDILQGWAAQAPDVQSGITLSVGAASFCSLEAKKARALLISTYKWNIADGERDGRCIRHRLNGPTE